MAGRNANISVKIEGEADFGAARREAKAAIDDIEKAADVTLTPELDTSEIRKAIDLAKTLDGLTAELTVDADISEIQQAEAMAQLSELVKQLGPLMTAAGVIPATGSRKR